MTVEEHEKELVRRIIYHKEQREKLQIELNSLRTARRKGYGCLQCSSKNIVKLQGINEWKCFSCNEVWSWVPQ